MTRLLTAFTAEVDDKEAAVEEVTKQLGLEANLLEHAVGIVTCYLDFMREGVVAAVCAALPFDVVGINTTASMASGQYGDIALSVAVLTSDEARFYAGVTAPLGDNPKEAIGELVRSLRKEAGDDAVFMLACMPLMQTLDGDRILEYMDAASGGLPVFGAVPADYAEGVRDPRTVFNGDSYGDRIPVVLAAGGIRPEFRVHPFSKDKILKQKAIITDSDRNILKGVNNMLAVAYMESIGLAKDGELEGANSIPFIIDTGDGMQVLVRDTFGTTPEGYIICGGALPVGATISVGVLDAAEVEKTAVRAAESIDKSAAGAIIFSCVGRSFALGFDTDAEIKKVRERLGDSLPYIFCYAGGEICPLKTAEDKLVNCYHNNSFITCVF